MGTLTKGSSSTTRSPASRARKPRSSPRRSDVLARIVIPTFNGRRWLDTCLPALMPECTKDVEVVVVDDGSSDDTVEWVRDRYPSVRTVALERNAGFAHACNRGAHGSDAKYLVF